MMETLRTTLIQTPLHWEDPGKNRKMFSEKLAGLAGKTDLVILPEMFTTGFSMNAARYAHGIEIYDYLQTEAEKGIFAIYGSVMFKDGNRFVNRGIFMRPNGDHTVYDKRHTFSLAKEQLTYDKGSKPVVVQYRDWKILLQICYDLRFPVYSRNTMDYDAAIYVANWPVPRVGAWDSLLKARAIENMAYCIGVNRVGQDGTGMDYCGHSQAYDVLGEPLFEQPWDSEGIKTVTLEKEHIQNYRSKLKFLQDRDRFTLDL